MDDMKEYRNKQVNSIGHCKKLQHFIGGQWLRVSKKKTTYIKDSVPRKSNPKRKLRFWGKGGRDTMLEIKSRN